MYQLIKKIEKVNKVIVNEQNVYLWKENKVYKNDKEIFIGDINAFYCQNDTVIIVYDNFKKTVFIKNNTEPEPINVKGLDIFIDSDNIIWSDWNVDYTKMFKHRVKLSTKEVVWKVESYFGKPSVFNHMLFGYNEKTLYKIDKESGQLLWEYDISQYGHYTNHWGEEKKVKVNKLIGVWKNQLILQLNNGIVLSVDSENGKLNWRKEQIDKSISSINASLVINIYYNPILNVERGLVYFLQGTNFLKLDLVKQEIACNW